MFNVADQLKAFREATNLSEEQFARFLTIDADHLRRVEAGEEVASPELVAEYAQIAGVEISDFMSASSLDSPPTLLFRSMPHKDLSVEEMANTEVHLVLGEFLRCTARVQALREVLGEPADHTQLDTWHATSGPQPIAADGDIYASAERAAERLRTQLGLGVEPITSMTRLLEEKLAVTLFFVSPDELYPSVEGASTLAPAPAILVNLINGLEREEWWRTRMTLAHELGHLLMDLSARSSSPSGAPLMLSPIVRETVETEGGSKKMPERWCLVDDHIEIEKRANAFAAALLAPPDAVRDCVGSDDPTSNDAIRRVGAQFGLGQQTAVNVLKNVFRLTHHTWQRMGQQSRRLRWDAGGRFDEHVVVGLYEGDLQRLALRALAEGRIGKLQARQYLNVPLTDALPLADGLTDDDVAPLLSSEQIVRRAVDRRLRQHHPDQDYHGGTVHRGDDGWVVEVLSLTSRHTATCVGSAHVTFEHEVDRVDIGEPPLASRDDGPVHP